MPRLHQALGVGEDRVVVLHHRVGREAAVLHRQAHRATGGVEAHAQLDRGLDLGGDEVARPLWVDVEVVGRGRAATHRQLDQADPRRDVRRLLVEAGPLGVERGQPGEQRALVGGPVGAGEVLVDVVMGVDQARRDEASVGPQHLDRLRRGVARTTDGGDQPAGHGDPSAGDLPALVVHRGHQLGTDDQQVDGAVGSGIGGRGRGDVRHPRDDRAAPAAGPGPAMTSP